MTRGAATVGVAEHTNSAVLVTIGPDGEFLDRRRIVLTDRGLSTHPHHHEGSWAVGRYLKTPGARTISLADAVTLVERVRASADRGARKGLGALAASVPVPIAGIAIRACPALPPTIEERITDHRAQTVADSLMYREVLAEVAAARGWLVHWYDRERVFRDAAKAIGSADIEAFLRAMGRTIGPPWQAAHKLAAAAGLRPCSHVSGRPSRQMNLNLVTKIVNLGGERFPLVDVGTGPVVLLLHGFPDSRFLWRHQIPALSEAGYRVIAPDLRGFGEAPRPTQLHAYRRPFLVADVLGLLDQLGLDRVHLVGHDWGASLSWRIAGSYPDRVDRLVVLSVGAPASPGWETIAQREKSWYFDFFCKPGIAEATLEANDWALFREWCRGQGDLERYLSDLARPGAFTAALNWYRAAFMPLEPGEPSPPALPAWSEVKCPTLGVWGEGDPFLLEPQIALSAASVAAPWRYERMSGAGHWLMLDQPDALNRLLLTFLQGGA